MNIYGGTKYSYAEEDRLTNALLSLFEHSEKAILTSFLQQLKVSGFDSSSFSFETQVPYYDEGSRPDGRIASGKTAVIIENKRHENLDKAQLHRHIRGMLKYETSEHKYLLCLSNDTLAPSWLPEMKDEGVMPLFFSWSDMFRFLAEVRTGCAVSAFLIREPLKINF